MPIYFQLHRAFASALKQNYCKIVDFLMNLPQFDPNGAYTMVCICLYLPPEADSICHRHHYLVLVNSTELTSCRSCWTWKTLIFLLIVYSFFFFYFLF